jgi:hypothetical protein
MPVPLSPSVYASAELPFVFPSSKSTQEGDDEQVQDVGGKDLLFVCSALLTLIIYSLLISFEQNRSY